MWLTTETIVVFPTGLFLTVVKFDQPVKSILKMPFNIRTAFDGKISKPYLGLKMGKLDMVYESAKEIVNLQKI